MPPNNFNLSEIEVNTRRISNGHDIRYDFSLYNAAAISREFTLTQNYFQYCITTPSSWKFTMTLHRNPSSGVVSCEVQLERLARIAYHSVPDPAASVPIVADSVLTFRHEDFSHDFSVGDNGQRVFLPGIVRNAYIETIVPNAFQHLLRGEIFVTLNIFVRNCHEYAKRGSDETMGGAGTR